MIDNTLEDHRDRWIDGVCDSVLRALGEFGVDLTRVVRPDLGSAQLTAALLTAHVAIRLAGGDSRWQVVEHVAAARVLRPEAASDERLLRLVDQVEALLFARGLPAGEPWDPRTGFTLLLETWAVERRQAVGDDAIEE